jgi:hypothetical protein
MVATAVAGVMITGFDILQLEQPNLQSSVEHITSQLLLYWLL